MQYIHIGDITGTSPIIPLLLGAASVVFAGIAIYLLVNRRKYTLSEWFPVSTWSVAVLAVLLAAGTLLSFAAAGDGTFTPNLEEVTSRGYEIRGDATDEDHNPLPDQNNWPAEGGVTLPLRHTDTGRTCLGVTTTVDGGMQLAVACYDQ